MKSPRLPWLIFGIVLLVVLVVMGWVSSRLLKLDASGREMRQVAHREERIRLALWRMDAIAASLVADEWGRPYFHYAAFHAPGRAYGKMFESRRPGEWVIPSPLLLGHSPHIRLHFQVGPVGRVESPQLPTGDWERLAVEKYDIESALVKSRSGVESLGLLLKSRSLRKRLTDPREEFSISAPIVDLEPSSQSNEDVQTVMNQQEFQKRLSSYSNTWKNRKEQSAQKFAEKRTALDSTPDPVLEGSFRALWVEEELLLARRVLVGNREYVQGCWIDRQALERDLLAEISDLLPRSELKMLVEKESFSSRQLASLPMRLVPGNVRFEEEVTSPLPWSLGVAWGAVLLAATAFAILLGGILSLADRRAAFVSAVTHELRTPLTTLRMNTEMLAEGMVVEESKRQEMFRTLEVESSRLAHLVENVLSYAQLERGGRSSSVQFQALQRSWDRVGDRLKERAEQGGMELILEDLGGLRQGVGVRVDPVAFDQILFNLVDNAVKYAREASDRRIHVEVIDNNGWVDFRVRDHGPGVRPSEIDRLFQPFRKSAAQSAESAPGVGLGLALSRRLSRVMGGDLKVDPSVEGGAAFFLTLPRVKD